MAVFAEFFKHSEFEGASAAHTLSNSWRYRWVKFGGTLSDEISSFRGRAYSGFHGHVYGFTERNFLGDYAALNMGEGWTCWWSYVGDVLNDDIESALLINRSQDEITLDLKDQIAETFADEFDEASSGTEVSRKGDPRVYSLFWPSHDSSKKFVRIEQDLRVAVDWWPDYDARVQYDIYLYLDGEGHVNGYVAWTHTWVEGGIFRDRILDELHPKMVEGAGQLTDEIQNRLADLSFLSFSHLYLLPGRVPDLPPPSSEFGHTGNAKENATLVLVP